MSGGLEAQQSLSCIALGMTAAAAAVAAYWFFKFRRLLPLERALRRRGDADARHRSFAHELLAAPRLPATPQSLSDSLQFGTDRFLARFGGLDLFVWMRMSAIASFPEAPPELACRTGSLEAIESRDLRLSDELWERVARADGIPVPPEDSAVSKVFGRERPPRLIPWGVPGRLWGVLGAFDADPASRVLVEHEGALDLLAAYFGSLAERSARFWELDQAREQLEGGLSATMQRLDETNLQLIRKAREMKTFQEVTDAISEHPDQPEVLGAIVGVVAKALEADLCAFLLLDESTSELVTQPGHYGLSDDESSLYRISLSNQDSSSVRVFRSGTPFITGDAQSDPQVIAHYARLWKCHSLMVVPLSVEGRRIGVMRVGSRQRDFFQPEHVQLVKLIAEEAAVLVESAVMSQKLQESHVQLAQLHSIKDDFVSTVSHEFKTPLTSIKGFLAILLDEDAGPLTGEQKRFLGIAMSAADRLAALVSDMLDISKLEGGLAIELSRIPLQDTARTSVESQLFAAEERGVELDLRIPESLPPVHGNPEWLRQVFDNLISNSLKFTPKGGKVAVSLSDKGECVMATVSDTGVGVPEADRERIFERFYRASNREAVSAPGTGLGLAICRSIIDKHDGRIWFESKDGKGTDFHFIVPVAKQAAAVEAD